MSNHDFRTWLIIEHLKALEKEGKAGFLQHARLMKKYRELTGVEWKNETHYQRNSS